MKKLTSAGLVPHPAAAVRTLTVIVVNPQLFEIKPPLAAPEIVVSTLVTPSPILITAFGEQPTGAVLACALTCTALIGRVSTQVNPVQVDVRGPGKKAVSVSVPELQTHAPFNL